MNLFTGIVNLSTSTCYLYWAYSLILSIWIHWKCSSFCSILFYVKILPLNYLSYYISSYYIVFIHDTLGATHTFALCLEISSNKYSFYCSQFHIPQNTRVQIQFSHVVFHLIRAELFSVFYVMFFISLRGHFISIYYENLAKTHGCEDTGYNRLFLENLCSLSIMHSFFRYFLVEKV